MKKERKHNHHDKPRVDLERQRVRLDGETYRWKEHAIDFTEDDINTDLKWYRVSKKHCRRDGKEVRFVAKQDRSDKYTWKDTLRRLSDRKDRRRIRKLEHLLDREERSQASDSASASESDAAETESQEQESVDVELTPWQKHTQQGPPEKGCEIKRSKYGIRIFSNDHKTYWDICVNNSKKYSGNTSVRIFVGGKAWTSTFDLETMEALRREFGRGKRP